MESYFKNLYFQGILAFLGVVFGERFFFECYTPLGDLMDMMALINCSINFIIYCLMSRQFRTTFKKICHIKVTKIKAASKAFLQSKLYRGRIPISRGDNLFRCSDLGASLASMRKP